MNGGLNQGSTAWLVLAKIAKKCSNRLVWKNQFNRNRTGEREKERREKKGGAQHPRTPPPPCPISNKRTWP